MEPAGGERGRREEAPAWDASLGETFSGVFSSIRTLFQQEFGCCAPEEDAATRHEKLDRSFRMRPAFTDDFEEEAQLGRGRGALIGAVSSSQPPPAARGAAALGPEVKATPTSSSTCSGGEGQQATGERSHDTLGTAVGSTTVAFGEVLSIDAAGAGELESGLVERPERPVEGGEVLYAGQWLGEKMHGRGTARWLTGEQYSGRFREGLPHGQGKFTERDGSAYQGAWEAGEKHGFGVYFHADGTMYEGQWRHDQKSGIGMERWPDGAKYEGQYYEGLKHGRGVFRDESVEYCGLFAQDLMHGQGTYVFADGRTYNGDWVEGHMTGQGRMEFPSGAVYEGGYEDDLKHGRGSLTLPNGCSYSGEWFRGKKHGTGRATDAQGHSCLERYVLGVLQGVEGAHFESEVEWSVDVQDVPVPTRAGSPTPVTPPQLPYSSPQLERPGTSAAVAEAALSMDSPQDPED